MKKLLFLLLLSGCGVTATGHIDPISINPVQVEVSTVINYNEAEQFCSNQCNGNQTCTNSCYDQFIEVLAASSALPVPSPTPGG